MTKNRYGNLMRYDCCQVVFRYCEKLMRIREPAYKVSSDLYWYVQERYVVQLLKYYMALGLKYGSTLPSPEGDEQRVESIIKDVEFRENFTKYNSTMCRELMVQILRQV